VRQNLPPGYTDVSKLTGKPLPPDLQKAVNLARSTNDLIDAALGALAPFKNDNTQVGALRLAKNYRQGIFDPVQSAASQLADLAGIQAAASQALTAGSSRALAVYEARVQHVPKLPSARQIEFWSTLGIPARTVGTVSRFIKSDEGGFDTPQAQYHKLEQVKARNLKYIEEAMNIDIPLPGPGGIRPVPSHEPAQTGRPGDTLVFDPTLRKYVFR